MPPWLVQLLLFSGAPAALAYSGLMISKQHCDTPLTPGTKIMCCDQKMSTDRSVGFHRNGKALKCGDKYVPGEILTAHISQEGGMYVMEVNKGASFTDGSCPGKVRVTQSSTDVWNNFPLTAPEKGTLRLTAGWATKSMGQVYLAACELKCCSDEKPGKAPVPTTTPAPTTTTAPSTRRRSGTKGRRRRRRSKTTRRRRAPPCKNDVAAASGTPDSRGGHVVDMKYEKLGCFPLVEGDQAAKNLAPTAESLRDVTCAKHRASPTPCRSGLPFFRLQVHKEAAVRLCFTFCSSRGLDLFGLVGEVECRCGATMANRKFWKETTTPHKSLILQNDTMLSQCDAKSVKVYRYSGWMHYSGVPGVQDDMLDYAEDDADYMKSIIAGHFVKKA